MVPDSVCSFRLDFMGITTPISSARPLGAGFFPSKAFRGFLHGRGFVFRLHGQHRAAGGAFKHFAGFDVDEFTSFGKDRVRLRGGLGYGIKRSDLPFDVFDMAFFGLDIARKSFNPLGPHPAPCRDNHRIRYQRHTRCPRLPSPGEPGPSFSSGPPFHPPSTDPPPTNRPFFWMVYFPFPYRGQQDIQHTFRPEFERVVGCWLRLWPWGLIPFKPPWTRDS